MGQKKNKNIRDLVTEAKKKDRQIAQLTSQVRGLAIEFVNLAEYVNGAMQEFGRQLFGTTAIQAAMIEHLAIDEPVKALVEKNLAAAREKEAADEAAREKEAADEAAREKAAADEAARQLAADPANAESTDNNTPSPSATASPEAMPDDEALN